MYSTKLFPPFNILLKIQAEKERELFFHICRMRIWCFGALRLPVLLPMRPAATVAAAAATAPASAPIGLLLPRPEPPLPVAVGQLVGRETCWVVHVLVDDAAEPPANVIG